VAGLWTAVLLSIVAGATLKTFFVVSFVLPHDQARFGMVSGLFAAFTALTAGVAYLCYAQPCGFIER